MGTRFLALYALAAAPLLFGLSQNARGQTLPNEDIETAKAFIASGNGEAARGLLEPLVADDPGNVELLFLLGMVALGSEDPETAITWFRRALVYEPSATRIRLELARAFYQNRDYDNAFRQFQFARAGNPPAGVVASIDRYLTAIRQEKNWSYNLSIVSADGRRR